MGWRKPGEATPRKAKVTQSAKKIIATIFWVAKKFCWLVSKKESPLLSSTHPIAQIWQPVIITSSPN
jgi:hypothetical protein